jgi:type I restriction-modification system DNA methylase subunit
MVKYMCEICSKESSQKCHHDSHLKSKDHKNAIEIFRLKMVAKDLDEIIEEYPQFKSDRLSEEDFLIDGESEQDNIEAVKNAEKNLKYDIVKKIIKMKATVKSDEIAEVVPTNKYKHSNNIVWELSENVDENENYKGIKSSLESLIKQCHNILYNSSIVGQKAQNDIMRLLCIKILQYQFQDENSELWGKCNQVKADNNISDTTFAKYKKFCKDLKQIYKTKNGLLTEWKGFVNKFLIYVFPSIYYEDDSKFNCIDENIIQQLINKIETLEINDEFIDSFTTTCGDIHESFRSYSGGKGAKELGQYFTPRQLIHLIFHGLDLNQYLDKIENPSIYDPCMGTGGFLTRLFNLGNINPENIYGCETELDTIKFGEMSLFLTTKGNKQKIVKCNSLSENSLMINTKVDTIVTNPPFGTKMNYKSLKETYEKTFPDSTIKFKDIYPLEVNNGACLFVQHCVYMLNEGGVCAIVLPDGELFEGNSKWSKNFRKWLCENVNIHTILKCPGGTFDHAGVKTNVVVFTKTGPTQNIKYIETTKKCEKINELFTITEEDLKSTNYSLDINEYIEEKEDNFENMVRLSEICELEKGNIQSSKRVEGEYKLVSQSNSRTHNEYKYDGQNVFVSCVARVGQMYYYEGKCHATTLLYNLKIKEDVNINPKYLYLVLDNNDKTYECEKGSANKSLDKDKFMKLKIPLPSLEIQEKIIEELSMIETNITSIETRIKQLKDEKGRFKKYSRKSGIKELLKDVEIKKLGEVCEFKWGKNIPKRDRIVQTENNYPYYGSNGISGYTGGYTFEGKNILLGDQGSQWFNSLHFTDMIEKYNISNHTINISCKDIINIDYLYYLLKFLDLKNFNKDCAMIPEINFNKFKDFKIPVPSPEIQEQCIQIYQEKETFIQSIDDKIEAEKNYINDLQQLSKDIIHNYC